MTKDVFMSFDVTIIKFIKGMVLAPVLAMEYAMWVLRWCINACTGFLARLLYIPTTGDHPVAENRAGDKGIGLYGDKGCDIMSLLGCDASRANRTGYPGQWGGAGEWNVDVFPPLPIREHYVPGAWASVNVAGGSAIVNGHLLGDGEEVAVYPNGVVRY